MENLAGFAVSFALKKRGLKRKRAKKRIVKFLDFPSTKQGLPLFDSWSRGLAFIHLHPERGNILNPSGDRTPYYTYRKYQEFAVKFSDQG